MTKRASPNLVFVFPDEWRAQSLGFRNQDPVVTPNLDPFAAESKVLTQAVSNFPVCSPFRAMLMEEGSDYSLVLTGDDGEKPTSGFSIVPNLDNPKFGNRGLRTDDYTFVIQRSEKGETVHLYNLSEDPYQQKDCAAVEPEIVACLRMELNDWLQKTKDPWDKV